ncbi:beta-defensin 121-like [Lutra lutra]|uniref:beta-defensin 121-like n=1 Tax=Lutra lutra TaxID=9657 RepID=UPI001FCFB103|nr:beta-defensin 121-like [Lutra lutra]
MRLLLLAFAILMFLSQMTPVITNQEGCKDGSCGGGEECWHKSGYCRKTCRLDKVTKTICQHYQVCCVADQNVPVTSPTLIPNFQTDIIDILVTSLTSPSFEINTKSKDDEKCDSELKMQIFL